MKSHINKKILSIVVPLLIVLVALPIFVENNYIIATLVTCFAFASFGTAWNIISGYGSQLSWCHASFVAIGAYSGMVLYKFFEIGPWVSMIPAVTISLVLSTVIGYGTLKLRGAYFSIATIAFAEGVRVTLLYFKDVTGGASGIYATWTGASFKNLIFDNDKPFYYIFLVVLCLFVIISAVFNRSKTGYYLSAIKGDEDAALSLGIETFKVKLKAFQLSAVLTTIAGVIYGFFLTYVEPVSVSGLDLSIKIGTVAIVGGVSTLFGPVLGAFIIIPTIELANTALGQFGGGQILYGIFLIAVVIFQPQGLINLGKGKDDDYGNLRNNPLRKLLLGKGK